MSEPAQPSDSNRDVPPAGPVGQTPAPEQPSPGATDESSSLEVMPEAAPVPGDAGGQQLAVSRPAGAAPGSTAAPTPIDYAMPSQPKSWLPSPALVKNLGCIFKMLAGFTVMLCVGYFMLMALNPKARQWALQGRPPADGSPADPANRGPTPFKFMNQMLALPAQALAKTDDVVKANNARAGVVDGMVAEEERKSAGAARRAATNPFASGGQAAAPGAGPAKGAAAPKSEADAAAEDERAALAARMLSLAEQGAANPAAPKADAVRSTAVATSPDATLPPVTLPGGVVIRDASTAGAPPAGRPFFYWVVNASISGISPGPPARLLVAGRLTYEGTEVYIPLGIVFVRLDPAGKVLYFRDSTGAIVTRSY